MGWFSDVADILEQRGYFQLVTHDGTKFREVDELESERDALKTENVRLTGINVGLQVASQLLRSERDALRTALQASTELLEGIQENALEEEGVCFFRAIKRQITANEAVM